MNLLLDTHSLLWYGLNDPKLSVVARRLILDPQNIVLLSPVSFWEIAIKVSIGKLALHHPFEEFIDLCLVQNGFKILPIEPRHTARVITLGFPSNHKDPFDRLLVSQAIVEQVPIVSDDPHLDAYPIQRLWK